MAAWAIPAIMAATYAADKLFFEPKEKKAQQAEIDRINREEAARAHRARMVRAKQKELSPWLGQGDIGFGETQRRSVGNVPYENPMRDLAVLGATGAQAYLGAQNTEAQNALINAQKEYIKGKTKNGSPAKSEDADAGLGFWDSLFGQSQKTSNQSIEDWADRYIMTGKQ